MNISGEDQLRILYDSEQFKRRQYIRLIAETIGQASEFIQENQENFRKFWRIEKTVEGVKEHLKTTLQLLSRLHAPEPSEFPKQECDGAALLKIFQKPQTCSIIASWGNIPSEEGIPSKHNQVNFTPNTERLQIIFDKIDYPSRPLEPIREEEYIHSIDENEVNYNEKPQSTLFIPTYSYQTVFGLLYFHSSQKGWFQHCDPFPFLLLGNKIGRFFQYMPQWLEGALCN